VFGNRDETLALVFEIVLQVVTNNLTTPFIHDDFGIKCIP